MSKKPIPLPIPVEEADDEECPKCPPVGAPAWMATFADMATLLMAFFVLILSFAEFNQPKFKMVAGSLKNAFGVQREVPVVEQPKGTTLLELTFSPSPEPSVTKEITQDTTEFDRKEIEQKTSNSPDEGNGAQGDGADQALADAIADALASGQVQVKTEDGKVVMSFEGDTESPTELAEQIQDAAQAIEQAKASGASTSDVQLEGLADALPQLAQMTGQDSGSTGGESEGTGTPADGESERKAAIAEAELRVALREEVSQGLVTVEQEENKVKITVGAGGAFRSGKADL
ncbi:MAG: flagellar motor protein MotB, partial [Pseudomonadota bacterium]|nr:flagellar motor protein MotB [Pseudomonadota bacterium]